MCLRILCMLSMLGRVFFFLFKFFSFFSFVCVGNLSMESITSISSVTCWPLTYYILYVVELVLWSSQGFCHFFSMNLLMISFRSVYGIFFLLDMSTRSVFLQHCLPFHFHVYQCGLVSRWEWCYYFWKECLFSLGVLWWRAWSLSGW